MRNPLEITLIRRVYLILVTPVFYGGCVAIATWKAAREAVTEWRWEFRALSRDALQTLRLSWGTSRDQLAWHIREERNESWGRHRYYSASQLRQRWAAEIARYPKRPTLWQRVKGWWGR